MANGTTNGTVDTNFCVYVNSTCPVKATVYGYAPSLGANAFFLAFFAICFIWQIIAGITWRTWTFMIAMGFGCVGEAIGTTHPVTKFWAACGTCMS